jgi:SAM-dependent MidA family methyltransferase
VDFFESLPDISNENRQRSNRFGVFILPDELGNEPLVETLCTAIAESPFKAISFCDFMNLCLYHPEYGYYTGSRPKVGKDGDFYTSSSIGSILGEMIASHIIQWHDMGATAFQFIEWGGGNGQLARQILDGLQRQSPAVYKLIKYRMIEKSDFHQTLQREALRPHAEKVEWLTAAQWRQMGSRIRTIIFSNELLDAFPVHRIHQRKGQLYEIYIGWDRERKAFVEKQMAYNDGPLCDYLQLEGITLRDGQTAEINLAAPQWITEMLQWLEEGCLITIDYGDIAEEIYAAHRMNGTLLCYRRHQAVDEPLKYIGEQDITSHVNFSACIRAGKSCGATDWKLQTQREFLVEAGVLSLLQEDGGQDPFSLTAKRNRAIRQLLWSDQMSELFKVLLQTKKG